VIICGGSRDVARNEVNTGLRHTSQFPKSTSDTNIIMWAPTSFDFQSSSSVNKEAVSLNRKLYKTMNIYSHVQVCTISTNRDHFTPHGFHMNTQGKNWLTNTWNSIIKTFKSTSLLVSSIPLP